MNNKERESLPELWQVAEIRRYRQYRNDALKSKNAFAANVYDGIIEELERELVQALTKQVAAEKTRLIREEKQQEVIYVADHRVTDELIIKLGKLAKQWRLDWSAGGAAVALAWCAKDLELLIFEHLKGSKTKS